MKRNRRAVIAVLLLAPLAADTDPARQAKFTRVYQATAGAFDRRGLGAIKAWFCGSRCPIVNKTTSAAVTFAIFSDSNAVGHVERRYITDALARPRPLVVAGRIERYGYDFATRTLEVVLKPDAASGATEIFVAADRFYPGGFGVEVGPGLSLAMKPGKAHLRTVRSAGDAEGEQAQRVRWDEDTQRLVIEQWILKAPRLVLRVMPMAKAAARRAMPRPRSRPGLRGGLWLGREAAGGVVRAELRQWPKYGVVCGRCALRPDVAKDPRPAG